MAGIYFHIPFCKQACHYCNFHFSTSLKQKDEMIDALINELALTSSKENIDTLYFGGGTPSLLTADEIQKLLEAVNKHFNVSAGAEITLETNPDDINEKVLDEWKLIGINRFSIGVQSFKEKDLVWMNRAHNRKYEAH